MAAKEKKPKVISVLWVPVGENPVLMKVEATVPAIYTLINGGPMIMTPYAENVNVVSNANADEGTPLPLNRSIYNGQRSMRGDYFFTRLGKKNEMVGVTEMDAARIVRELM